MGPEIFVTGVGSTKFGAFSGERSARSLACEAIRSALADAELEPGAVEMAYAGYSLTGVLTGQESMVGQLSLEEAGIVGVPVMHVENACSSGSSALNQAVMAIRSGAAETVIVFGVEVMTSVDTAKAITGLAGAGDVALEGSIGQTFPAHFAMVAQRHSHEFGTTAEQIASVAVKNHAHGALNPKAHFQRPVTLEQVLGAKRVAGPLGIFDCCPVSDGAAALVLQANKSGRGGVKLRACELVSGSYQDERPLYTFEATRRAADAAFSQAGVELDDVDLFEMHDCFTIAEIVHCEDLGLCEKGDGGPYVESGATRLGGEKPVNVSGGLKSKGHPVGATGISQVVELTDQLRGEAGPRQVEGARVGLAQCMGGFLHGDCGSMTVSILVV